MQMMKLLNMQYQFQKVILSSDLLQKYCYNFILKNKKEQSMTVTAKLDEKSESKLNNLANTLHKKKSDIIREAIE